jgi:hypothetical protein
MCYNSDIYTHYRPWRGSFRKSHCDATTTVVSLLTLLTIATTGSQAGQETIQQHYQIDGPSHRAVQFFDPDRSSTQAGQSRLVSSRSHTSCQRQRSPLIGIVHAPLQTNTHHIHMHMYPGYFRPFPGRTREVDETGGMYRSNPRWLTQIDTNKALHCSDFHNFFGNSHA